MLDSFNHDDQPNIFDLAEALALIRQYGNGSSVRAVAYELGISDTTVWRMRKEPETASPRTLARTAAWGVGLLVRQLAAGQQDRPLKADFDTLRLLNSIRRLDEKAVKAGAGTERAKPAWLRAGRLCAKLVCMGASSRAQEYARHGALFSLSRNPIIGAKVRRDCSAAGLRLSIRLFRQLCPHVDKAALLEVLQVDDVQDHPGCDFEAFVLSGVVDRALFMVYHLHGERNWRRCLRWLQANGLLDLLAVRGLVVQDARPLVNLALSLWHLDQMQRAELVLKRAAQIYARANQAEPDMWNIYWWRPFDDKFRDWAGTTLGALQS